MQMAAFRSTPTQPPTAPGNLTATRRQQHRGGPQLDGSDEQPRHRWLSRGAMPGHRVHQLHADRRAGGNDVRGHDVRAEHRLQLPRPGSGHGGKPERLLERRRCHHADRHPAADDPRQSRGDCREQQPDRRPPGRPPRTTSQSPATCWSGARMRGARDFAQIATPTGTGYSDTGLLASTSYSYRVRATDAAGNPSGYSTPASATTPAVAQPPTPPGNLVATAVSASQIQPHLDGFDEQRRRRRVPGGAVPGSRLHELRPDSPRRRETATAMAALSPPRPTRTGCGPPTGLET